VTTRPLSPDELSFIVFVGDWNPAFPTNPKYFSWNIARLGYKALAVAVGGPLAPLQRINPRRWTSQQPRLVEENLWLLEYRWPMLMRTAGGLRRNCRYMRANMERLVEQFGFPSPTYYLHFTPTYFHLALEVNPRFPLVYRPIDDFTEVPAYSDNPEYWLAGEKRMLDEAFLIAPVGRKVCDRISAAYTNVRQISTGVDFDLFATPQPEPDDLKGIPRPRLGFCGAIDRYKIDFRLVEAIADLRPNWQCVYVGRIGTRDDTTPESLPHRPNIHYIDHREHEVMPAYTQAFDLGIMPMNVNEYTTGISPLKLYENYAVGLPIVSTPLPYVLDEPTVYTAEGAEQFVAACERALEERSEKAPRLVEIARRSSWSQRARELIQFVSEYTGSDRNQSANARRPFSSG
jgi:glycosyltransferase involved in cell wall biosynthesis